MSALEKRNSELVSSITELTTSVTAALHALSELPDKGPIQFIAPANAAIGILKESL